MNPQLQACTPEGAKFVALAEEHAADFATRAEQHDREGSFPFENIEALQKSGFMAGPVPVEFGGIGVESARDLMTGMSRLARGCASTAIAANMHITAANVMARIWRNREAINDPAVIRPTEAFLRAIGAGQLIAAVPATEAGTDVASPMAEVTPEGDGYVLNGRKLFGTMAPAAQILFSTARLKREDGGYNSVLAIVPKAAPGVEVVDNWDALGMRASGSGDVVYTNVRLPAGSIVPTGEWGTMGGGGGVALGPTDQAPLVACFLGIAEAARDIALEMAMRKKGPKGKRLADRVPIQQLIAEIEIELNTCRAVTDRFARIVEEHPLAPASPEDDAVALQREQQLMKWTLQRAAINIVDRAMTVTGGAAFMRKHPLSRLYRDVRAGPFMQPFAPYEALEYIGKVTLGLPPELDR